MTVLHVGAGVGLALGLILVFVSLLRCLAPLRAGHIDDAPSEISERTDVALIDRAEQLHRHLRPAEGSQPIGRSWGH